jgi:hypothetical protein
MESWDQGIAQWVAAHRTETFTDLATFVMDAGTNPLVLVMCATILMLYALLQGMIRLIIAVPIAAASAVIASLILKNLFIRSRPPVDLVLQRVRPEIRRWSFCGRDVV